MSANLELSETAREILHPPLTWPGPILKGAQRIWQNVSGQRAAYETGLKQGIILAARVTAHRINNQVGPVLGYGELLSMKPAIRNDEDARECVGRIVQASHDVAKTVELLGRIKRFVFDQSLNISYQLLDLEASSQPEDSK